MADGPMESREEEVARVRSYLASQSLRRTPAELVETLLEAHQQFLAALALAPDVSFHIRPREGEWSAADVLLHMRTMAACDASAIPAVIDRGDRARERLALGLGHQAKDELGELFKVPDIVKDRAEMATIVVNEGNGVVGRSNAGNGDALLIGSVVDCS